MPDIRRSGIAMDYRIEIADYVKKIEHELGRGSARDFPEYLAKCAEIKAYLGALRLFEATLERYLSTEEHDELDEVFQP
jgi:hypothetical protein